MKIKLQMQHEIPLCENIVIEININIYETVFQF